MTKQKIYQVLYAYLKIKKAVGRSPMIKVGNSYLDHQGHLNYPWFSALTLIQETEKSLPAVVRQAEAKLKQFDRQPAVILDPATTPKNTDKILKGLGYNFAEDDNWLFLPQNQTIDSVRRLRAERATSKAMAQDYVDKVHDPVFAEWGKIDLSRWINSYAAGPNEHEYTYLYYFNDQLAAMGGLQRWRKFALLYDLAVLPQFRNQGFGAEIFGFLINQARELNSPIIFYDTEAGSAAEKLGLKLGFRPEFQRKLYTK